MARNEAISEFLGYASMLCWLGAQFPQIIVNWRRKSVDGLALPFLANWLLGDTTNLIGCLLTDQLPFQTYLATYFVFVDLGLISQFLYYDARRATKPLSILSSPSAYQGRAFPSSFSHSPESDGFPRTRVPRSRSGSYSLDPQLRAAVANMAHAASELDARYQQDSLASEVDVHSSHGRWRGRGNQRASSLEGLPESVVVNPREHEWGGRRLLSLEPGGGDVEPEFDSIPTAMVDSFHSEGGGQKRSKAKHVSWTRESTSRERNRRSMSQDPLTDFSDSSNAAPSTARGRQLARSTVYDSPITIEAPFNFDFPPRPRRTSNASAVSAAVSRRSASIVFLGVFALFGLSSHLGYRRSEGSQGSVLNIPTSHIPKTGGDTLPSLRFSHPLLSFPTERVVQLNDFEIHVSTDGDTERLIGRVSAWTCTTLYLTSRLPQIWKNFTRKSVEGLSMYLFIFAFLGNFFYVLSITTSPKMDLPPPLSKQFIRDSIPYLLGSGGTLMFDVTIVLQSFVYSPSRRGVRRSVRGRRKSLVTASGEEERGLLSAVPDRREPGEDIQ